MSLLNTGIQTCVICGEQVETKHVLSNLIIEHTDLDTRPRGLARNAEKNCVHHCPNCGYSSYNLEKDITFGLREILKTEEIAKEETEVKEEPPVVEQEEIVNEEVVEQTPAKNEIDDAIELLSKYKQIQELQR